MSQLIGITKRPQYLRSQAVAQQSLNKIRQVLLALTHTITTYSPPTSLYFLFCYRLSLFKQEPDYYLV